jgi:hypothetical protein
MATHEFALEPPPVDERARELWLQHATGFIIFEDVRKHAAESIDPSVDPECRAVALKAIDQAVYAMMMVADGVTGALRNGDDTLQIKLSVLLRRGDKVVQEMALVDGDGMCMGYHGWLQEDFGSDPVARRRQ